MKIRMVYCARSDKGRVRQNNEDNLYCDGVILDDGMKNTPFKTSGKSKLPAVFAIFDGMGGEEYGEEASKIAVKRLSEFSEKIISAKSEKLYVVVQEFVDLLNAEIIEISKQKNCRMGTTMALVVVGNDEIQVFNIGDTRVYVLSENRLIKVSTDHTVVNPKISKGFLTEQEARTTKEWGKLTACIGISDRNGRNFKFSTKTISIKDIKKILICSDGLFDMVFDDRIEQIIRLSKNAKESAKVLMSEALNNGGKDNTSMIVIDIKRALLSFV